jgi:pimeloyl-ACP methyl ester carboxylesterase
VNGTALSYVEAGQGPQTAVLVHGSLDDYRSWRYQIEPFAGRYLVLALSRRFHFPNEWDTDGGEYSAETHALDLAAFIETLAQPPVHLVTASYGGNVGLYMTSRRPELVRTLVLGEPPLLPWLVYLPGGKAHWQQFLDKIWYPARQAFVDGRLADGAQRFLDGVMGRPTMQHLGARGYQMIMDNAKEMQAEALASGAYFPPFTYSEAQAISQPVLLCKGELSPELFHMITDDLAKSLPAAQPPVTIAGASHPMHIGNPTAYNQLVLDFMQQNDANHGSLRRETLD